jgi:uncharacterized protein
MEVVKVGDVFEFTIINLDKDRRRMGLSLKSDAMSRLGQSGEGKRSDSERSFDRLRNHNAGPAKRVVVVKKGQNNTKGAPSTQLRDHNSSQQDRRFNSRDNDDGMSYNPFAAFFNK